ncbi:MAG TPA: DUF3429 domain-containing protein [Microvirga sp.]|jgi:hypothetical protein
MATDTLADRSIPTVPLLLGIGGLIPFAGLALMVATGWSPLGWSDAFLRLALASYGALILSFLGGIRWGLAVAMEDQGRARREYLISVVPQLLAWAALALPAPWELRALAALVVALGLLDYGLVCRGDAPTWFGRLRLGLSAGAGLALLVAGF